MTFIFFFLIDLGCKRYCYEILFICKDNDILTNSSLQLLLNYHIIPPKKFK